MDQRILWAIVCLGVGLVLFLIELFIPSAGLIGAMAALSLLAGIVLLFWVDTTAGLVGLAVVLPLLPVAIVLGSKIFPHTFVAKWLILPNPPRDAEAEKKAMAPSALPGIGGQSLVGRPGRAVTDLRPVGICLIDNQRVECLAERGVISAGSPIRVISVDGMETKVRIDET